MCKHSLSGSRLLLFYVMLKQNSLFYIVIACVLFQTKYINSFRQIYIDFKRKNEQHFDLTTFITQPLFNTYSYGPLNSNNSNIRFQEVFAYMWFQFNLIKYNNHLSATSHL